MIVEVDKQLLIAIIEGRMKNPLLKVGEINLRATLETLNEEAKRRLADDCRVFLIEKVEKVRADWQLCADVTEARMNVEELSNVDENFANIASILSEFQQCVDMLRVDNVTI